MKNILYILTFISLTLSSCSNSNQISHSKEIPTLADVGRNAFKNDIDSIYAPFPMPQLKKNIFNNRSVNIKKQRSRRSTISNNNYTKLHR